METDTKTKLCISKNEGAESSREPTVMDSTVTGSHDRALIAAFAKAASKTASFPKMTRYSGAAKKQCKKKKKRRRAAKIAHSLCSAVVPQAPSDGKQSGSRQFGVKRRFDDSSVSSSVDRVCKRLRQQDTETDASRAVSLTMAIVTESYPEEVIVAEGLTMLREAFCKEIHRIQQGCFVPRFLGTSTLRDGAAIITCADEMSLDWLTERIGRVSPWPGARLRVVGLEALRRYRAVAWIPGSPTVPMANVLDVLEKQNPGLRTWSWQILAENEVVISGSGRNIVFSIPEFSVLHLRTLNFKLFFGLEEIVITIEKEI